MKQKVSNNSIIKFMTVRKSGAITTIGLLIPHSVLKKGDMKVSLYDVSGRFVNTAATENSLDNKQVNVNFSGIESGIYLVKLFAGNELVTSDHIIIK